MIRYLLLGASFRTALSLARHHDLPREDDCLERVGKTKFAKEGYTYRFRPVSIGASVAYLYARIYARTLLDLLRRYCLT